MKGLGTEKKCLGFDWHCLDVELIGAGTKWNCIVEIRRAAE